MDASWSWPQIEMIHPAWLAALVVLPLVVYYWRRGLTDFSVWRRWATLACRALLLVALAVALSDLRITAPTTRQTVVAADDTSARIAETPPEVWVSEVQARCQVHEGEPFAVEAVIRSSHEDSGNVELVCGSQPVERKAVTLGKGENRVRFFHSITGERVATLTIRLSGFRDTLPENNAAGAVVFVTSRPRVMLVETESGTGAVSRLLLAEALKGEQIDVDVRSPDAFSKSLGDLESYELLVLSNVPAASLSQPSMEAMRTYVRDAGGGLIVIGGDQAFTPGGYRNTVLEDILPVRSEFQKKQPRPGLAIVLIIDRSLSMKGTAMELAKEATRRAVEMLDAKDQVGVIAFDDATQWVVPLQPCSDKASVLKRIDGIEAKGRTDMCPAMDKAYLALHEAFAPRKHMIVFTDGISQPGDFDSLAGRIANSGITVSTVAAGQEVARPLLEDIARIGNGKSYYCEDMAGVPKIFALEAASAAKVGIVERPFFPQVVRSVAALAELDFKRAPSLLGYVGTQPKPTSQVILASEAGDPLLVWWRYGLGVSVAFTSDVQSRWAAAWLRWPGFSRFWAQLVRHAMRRDDARDFSLRLDRREGQATATLEALDPQGEYVNGAEGTMTLIAPKQASRQVTLAQTAPGRYAAGFAAADCGTYYVEVRLSHQGRPVYAQRHGLVVSYTDEFRPRPINTGRLEAMAEATGGTHDPESAALVAAPGRAVPRTLFTWPYLVVAAAVMLVIDVALRRIVRREIPNGC